MTSLARRRRRRTVGVPAMRADRSLQSLFDQVVYAVRAQGYLKSEGDTESCMYYGTGGARCHVGLVIPEERYRPSFEGCTVAELRERGLCFADWGDEQIDLLAEFQAIHDDEFPEDWEAAFEGLADRLGLTYRRP